MSDEVRVVVLNACCSKAQAEAIVSVVPCAIGMNGAIGAEAARVFASSFYLAVGFGRSVKVTFQQGIAALKVHGIPEADMPRLLARGGVESSQVILVNPIPRPRD